LTFIRDSFLKRDAIHVFQMPPSNPCSPRQNYELYQKSGSPSLRRKEAPFAPFPPKDGDAKNGGIAKFLVYSI